MNIRMQKSVFKIAKMDCPSEENLIRLKLNGISQIANLKFDLHKRELAVFHNGNLDEIESAIVELNLAGMRMSTSEVEQVEFEKESSQSRLLWKLLAINFGFFIVEITTGLISKSMGLVADSLDMLADSLVYGISLLAVGGTLERKKYVAKLAGYFQILLAIIGLFEVSRRFFRQENLPDYTTMIVVSVLALMANGLCLYLLQKSNSNNEAHMKASMIFTSNDVIINVGVVLAAILVFWFDSNMPDLIIGIIVFLLVIRGAYRILKLGK